MPGGNSKAGGTAGVRRGNPGELQNPGEKTVAALPLGENQNQGYNPGGTTLLYHTYYGVKYFLRNYYCAQVCTR